MKDFEKAFSEFIDRREYDDTENALFSLVRKAFESGWRAARGEAVQSGKIIDFDWLRLTTWEDD